MMALAVITMVCWIMLSSGDGEGVRMSGGNGTIKGTRLERNETRWNGILAHNQWNGGLRIE